MSLLMRILKYLALPFFFLIVYFAVTLIPNSSAQREGQESSDPPLKRIKIMEVAPQPFEETILIPGVVEAYEDVNIGAGIPGIVEEVYVKEGDRVKKGQELFQIDLRSRQARLEDAKAAHELAQKSLERKKTLRNRGDITIQEYDEAVARELQAAAIMRSLEVEVSLGHIFAPMEGIIDAIDADAGEYMHEGSQLARLLSIDKIKIVVGIPERHADAVASEKTAKVHLQALNEIRSAELERIAFEANPQTNTFEATLILENKDHRIRPGMIIRAELVVKRVQDALLIPLEALVKRETGMVVFVVTDGEAAARPVEMGAFQKQFVEIVAGLQPYEKIVLIGQQDLSDGQAVDVVESVPMPRTLGEEGLQ
ncbi:MAG: efflux RND transporter periplasmic adaptor subunit [Candidatus Omnitrophica bacterium]|nr:efflux RND transporter periplasmic adaptor subunit [Candidatus Omnitrophota bacterium]